ncbi:hypothetical protein EDC96DRAFT_541751 [Choanephora cucurbitarum]|nr:hypothetical protein EDC96DRAFT_541751 [Choanephora cucurbitarum]
MRIHVYLILLILFVLTICLRWLSVNHKVRRYILSLLNSVTRDRKNSLSAHKDQISVDNCYQQSDVLLFTSRTSADKLIETLTPILSSGFSRCLIVSDFNISFLQASRRAERMRNFFSSFGLASRTMDKPSTIYNTKIDEVFSNFELENTGYYVSLTPSPLYPIYIECTQS